MAEPYLNSENLVDKLINELHRGPEEFHQEYRTRLTKYRDSTFSHIKLLDALPTVFPDMTEAVATTIQAKKRYLEALNNELRSEYSVALFSKAV